MTYRHFSPDREALAKSWAEAAMTSEVWTSKEKYKDTESKPFKAERSDGFLGLAKPGEPKGDDDAHAAHEKLASDFAYHLGLPIAPAILWDRGDGFATRYVSISAWAFDSCDSWDRLGATITVEQKIEIAPVFSAMAVFETWISAGDRNKGDAVLIDSASTSPVGLSFYDYAFSMSKYWKTTHSHHGKATSFFPAGITWQEKAGKAMADKIKGLSPTLVREIVTRIPTTYLTILKKNNIHANLIERSSELYKLMGIAH